jgi:protein-S-isoprenylcysteine O-methyltransferase Ste14
MVLAGFALLDLFQVTALAVFLLAIVSRTIYLRLRKKLNPITLRLRGKGWTGVAEAALVVTVNLWVAALLWTVLPLAPEPLPGVLGRSLVTAVVAKWAGLVLITAGFFVFFCALHALGDAWRLGIDDRETSAGERALVIDGIYRRARNPIYVFFNLYFWGTFLINGAAAFALLAALVTANLHCQILQEEQHLARVHGAAYEAYRARTGRYVTWR